MGALVYIIVGVVIGGIGVWLVVGRKGTPQSVSRSGEMIDVTQVGGAWDGPSQATVRTINKRHIKELTDPYGGELGTTVIVFNDGKRLYVTETKDEVRRRMQ